jgi:hypothetical protein
MKLLKVRKSNSHKGTKTRRNTTKNSALSVVFCENHIFTTKALRHKETQRKILHYLRF